MKKLIFATVIAFVLLGCDKKKEAKSNDKNSDLKVTDAMIVPPSITEKNIVRYAPPSVAPQHVEKEVSRKIIQEGDISFETNNISETRKEIYSSLKKLGGYVAEDNEANNSDNGRKQYELKIRIPANNFDQFVNGVSAKAYKIDSKNIRLKDVTAEFIDVSTQLENKKKLEGCYLDLLKKGNKISDLLEIENKLTEIRTDIESTQGQLNYLTKQVEYSSLDITFYSKQTAQDNGATFGTRFKSALSDGLDMLGSLLFGFIGSWPIWVIAVLAYFIFRAWRKNRKIKTA